MRTIELSDEFIDELVTKRLSTDYLNLINEVKAMEARIKAGEELKPYQFEDLNNWTKTVLALNILLDWYLTEEDARAIRLQATY